MASSTVSAAPTAPSVSVLTKIWTWLKKGVTIVESDLAAILGSGTAQKLEAIGKELLDGELGPLATAAIADATDVVSGEMSVSKAIDGLVSSATTSGKQLSKAAALQVIALVQNALPVSSAAGTVTPIA